MSLDYRPLVYMWMAEYDDGTALPQFDPETGRENRFGDVDQSKLKRFGWYPFSLVVAKKVYDVSGIIVIPTHNKSYITDIQKGQKLIAYRTNTIKMHARSGGIERGETIYVLGSEDGKILHISEDGSAEVK